MDISHPKFSNSTTWQPYNNNNISAASMEDHMFHNQTQTLNFDHHTQWSNYYPSPIIQNHNEPSNLASHSTFPSMDHDDDHHQTSNFKVGELATGDDHNQDDDEQEEELGAMKEMMFKIAAMQPVDIDPATLRKPRRRNVRISDDPQSVAARHRRERISEKIRIMQRLVPGGIKMDTASMLDEAIRYVKFLKRQIRILQGNHHHQPPPLQPSATTAIPGIPYLFGGSSDGGVAGDDHHAMCFNHKFINGDH